MRRRTVLSALPAAAAVPALAGCQDSVSGPSGSDGGGAGTDGSGTDGTTTSPSAQESTAAPVPPATERHAALLDALSPARLAGQLVWIGVPAGTRPDAASFAETGCGGLFLLGRWDSADDVRSVLEDARATAAATAGIAPLASVDQEGGQVRVLRGGAAEKTASAADLGAEGPDAVRAAYTTIGEDLASLGFAMALAPVADVVDPELGRANAPVGKVERGFGTDPETVGACVEAAVEGLAASGIASVVKHFPGLGRVRENTDFSADGITDETTSAEDPALTAFTRGVDAGAVGVMLASATYTAIDPDSPAMFSRAVVTDLLRDRLGFDGLAMTDDIGAAAAVADVPVGERATRFLAAGGDVVLTADPSLGPELAAAIADWAAASDANAQRVRESVARLLDVKAGLDLLR